MITLLLISLVGFADQQSIEQAAQEFADKIRLELNVGGENFGTTPNGTWYQETFPYELHMQSATEGIGLDYAVSDTRQIRIGYQYLGNVTSEALATASDENYEVCRNDHSQCWPLSHWYGKGNVQEVYITLDQDFQVHGMTFILEVGGAITHPTWHEDIPDWIGSPTDTPHDVNVTHNPNSYRTTPIFGIGWKITNNLSLMFQAQYLKTDNDPVPAVYDGWSESLTFRYEF